MPFYFTGGTQRLDLEDLPLDRWVTIQAATGLKWHEVLSENVIGDAKVASAVIAECAAHLGITVPPPTLKSAVKMIAFESEANVPEQFNDGVPDPKAPASEPVTT